jgi:hypothetical protein
VANVHGDEKVKIEKVTLNVSEVELKDRAFKEMENKLKLQNKDVTIVKV